MGRQGRDFGGQGGERRSTSPRGGNSFQARGARSNGPSRSGGSFARRGEEGRGFGPRFDGEGRSARPAHRDFGSRSEGRDARPRDFGKQGGFGGPRPQRFGNYRREDGARGGYPRSFEGSDRAPRAAEPQAAAQASTPLVAAQALKAGIGQANRAVAEVIEQFGHTLRGDYDIGALEVSVSFGADGRFLGFGQGGATHMKLTLTPLDAEAVVEGDDQGQPFTGVDLDEDEGEEDDALFKDDEEALTEGASAGNGTKRPHAKHAVALAEHGSEGQHFDA